MSKNPLTNIYNRLEKKWSSSRATTVTKGRYKELDLITHTYNNLWKKRSTSQDKAILEV